MTDMQAHHDLDALSQEEADTYFDQEEEDEFIMQEIERDELERMWASDAHKAMFKDSDLPVATKEDCEKIAQRYGL